MYSIRLQLQNSELQAFRDQVEFMIGDNESIGDHIKRMLLEDKDTEVYESESPLNLKAVQCFPSRSLLI